MFGKAVGFSIGSTALSALLNEGAFAQATRGVHHAPRARRVIYLSMVGGPSQMDMFEYKPLLDKLDGQPIPESHIYFYLDVKGDAGAVANWAVEGGNPSGLYRRGWSSWSRTSRT
jgi:hypothetical protein